MVQSWVWLIVACIITYILNIQLQGEFCYFNSHSLIEMAKITASDLYKIRIKKDIPSRIKGREQNISYIIHQTNENDEVPSDMAAAIESLVELNPEYAYRYYNATQRREFVEKHMGKTVLACYDKLIPNAYKADLWRYSVVYTYGGCYLDIGVIGVAHLRDVLRPEDIFVSTPDGLPPHVNVNAATFCAQAKSPILDAAIRRLVKRVANSQYGHDMLDITGPWIIRKGFTSFFKDPSLQIIEKDYGQGARLVGLELHPACRVNRLTYLTSIDTFVLTKYPRYSQDMSVYVNKLGYADLYNNRKVFDESVKVESDGNYSIENTKP